AKRGQGKHPGGSRLGFWRGKAFDRQHRGASIHRQRRGTAIHWQRWRTALDRERRRATLDRNGRNASIHGQHQHAALVVTIQKFVRQRFEFRIKRVQPKWWLEQHSVVQFPGHVESWRRRRSGWRRRRTTMNPVFNSKPIHEIMKTRFLLLS